MVGIAIINYKTYEKTIECIDSIRKTTDIPYKIYLLDNASPNESASILKREYRDSEDVELIISDTNKGYAKGNNVCIEKMVSDGCEYGIISNNDIICNNKTIDTLVNSLKGKKQYIIVGPRILTPNGDLQKSVIVKPYGKMEYLRKSTYLYKLHKRLIKKEMNMIRGLVDFTKVSWVSGAFFAFDVEKMNKIDNFDSNTFLFFEEYILAKKASENGYELGYNPKAVVIHDHAFSTGGGLNIDSKIIADRSEKYYFRNYTDNKKVFLLVLSLIRKMEVLISFGKRKQFSSIKKYFKGIK